MEHIKNKKDYLKVDKLETKGARKVIYCSRCLMPNTRPRVTFDKDGICNACTYADKKWKDVDWKARRKEFK